MGPFVYLWKYACVLFGFYDSIWETIQGSQFDKQYVHNISIEIMIVFGCGTLY